MTTLNPVSKQYPGQYYPNRYVRNQEQCGDCYAFSALECMSMIAALKEPFIWAPFDVNRAAGCSQFGQDGCNGGLPSQVFEASIQNPTMLAGPSLPLISSRSLPTFLQGVSLCDT